MEAIHKRRIDAATDDILADVRNGTHFMGEDFDLSEPPAIPVKLRGGDTIAKVHIIKNGEYAEAYGLEKRAIRWRSAP